MSCKRRISTIRKRIALPVLLFPSSCSPQPRRPLPLTAISGLRKLLERVYQLSQRFTSTSLRLDMSQKCTAGCPPCHQPDLVAAAQVEKPRFLEKFSWVTHERAKHNSVRHACLCHGLRHLAQNELRCGLEGIQRHPPPGLRDHGEA